MEPSVTSSPAWMSMAVSDVPFEERVKRDITAVLQDNANEAFKKANTDLFPAASGDDDKPLFDYDPKTIKKK